MIFFEFGPGAGVCVVGLVLALVFRRGLGRSAWLAIGAFAVLAVAFGGSLIWVHRINELLAETTSVDDQSDLIVLADQLQWVSGAVTVVGFALLIAAVVRR